MAKFTFNGADTLAASFGELANLSDEERMSVLRPSGDLLKERYVDKIKAIFTQRSGALANAITTAERFVDGSPVIRLYLKGKHPASGTGKRKRKDGRSNGKYSGTNAEVAYILEYGSPRIQATHWMETTNEEAADAIAQSQEAAWDSLLSQKGF